MVLAAAMMLLPQTLSAQCGLLQRGDVSNETNYGAGSKESLFSVNRNSETGIINNQTFGQEVPLSGGVVLLLATGAGYALLKRKEDEQ